MNNSHRFKMSLEAVSAYERTLRGLQEVSSHFSSWQAMMEEEENPDLAPSRACSFLPSPPEQTLLDAWMHAATAESFSAESNANGTSEETTCHRWTRFLGVWISLRLAGLIASSNTREGTCWASTRDELELYESSYLCTAWPMLGAGEKGRLRERLTHLQTLCRAALTPSSTAETKGSHAADDDDSYEAACRVICNSALNASQCVARDYLRITWDVLNPKDMPEVVDGRLHVLFSGSEEQQHRQQRSGRETPTLSPTSAASSVVHTDCMKDLLRTLQRTHQQHHTAGQTYKVWMRMVRTALLQIGYNLVVKMRAAMIDFCYLVLPALIDFEACVMLCEVMDIEKANAVPAVSASATPGAPASVLLGDAEETEKRDQLRRTLAALQRAAQSCYKEAIREVLAGYRRQCTSAASPPRLLTATAVEAPANPLTVPPQRRPTSSTQRSAETSPARAVDGSGGGGEVQRLQLALSQSAYALLVRVVEPTCNILRRYPAEKSSPRNASGAEGAFRKEQLHSPQTKKCGDSDGVAELGFRQSVSSSTDRTPSPAVKQRFKDFFAKRLNVCFLEALGRESTSTPSSKAQEQAAMDAYLVAAYLAAALRH